MMELEEPEGQIKSLSNKKERKGLHLPPFQDFKMQNGWGSAIKISKVCFYMLLAFLRT